MIVPPLLYPTKPPAAPKGAATDPVANESEIVPVLLYVRDNYDFSESVITKLNANRPAATPSPSAQKPASAAPTNTPATTVKPGSDLGKKPR